MSTLNHLPWMKCHVYVKSPSINEVSCLRQITSHEWSVITTLTHLPWMKCHVYVKSPPMNEVSCLRQITSHEWSVMSTLTHLPWMKCPHCRGSTFSGVLPMTSSHTPQNKSISSHSWRSTVSWRCVNVASPATSYSTCKRAWQRSISI